MELYWLDVRRIINPDVILLKSCLQGRGILPGAFGIGI